MAQTEDGKIREFLSRELSELRVRRRAKRLVTTPTEITRRTGLGAETVKECLSRLAEKTRGVAVVKVGKTDVVIRLTGPQAKRARPKA